MCNRVLCLKQRIWFLFFLCVKYTKWTHKGENMSYNIHMFHLRNVSVDFDRNLLIGVYAESCLPNFILARIPGPTQPPIQGVLWAVSGGVKWLECEADHSPPSSAEVRNVWSCTSTPTELSRLIVCTCIVRKCCKWCKMYISFRVTALIWNT
jgi:hypothetical protein